METDIIKQFRTLTWIFILMSGTFFGISFQTNPDEIYSEALLELSALEVLNYDQYINSLEKGFGEFEGIFSCDESFIKHLNIVINRKCIQECNSLNLEESRIIHVVNERLSYPIKFNLPSPQSSIEEIHSFLINPQEIEIYYPNLYQLVDFIFEKQITPTVLKNSSDTIFISSASLPGQVETWNTSENQILKRKIVKKDEVVDHDKMTFQPFIQRGVFFKGIGLKELKEDSNPISMAIRIYGNGNSKILAYCSLMWSEISSLTVFEAVNFINNKQIFDSGNISVLGFNLPRTPISIFIIILFFGMQFYALACILEVKSIFVKKDLRLKGYICLPFMGNAIGTILTFLIFLITPVFTLVFWNYQSKFYTDNISYVIIGIYAVLSFITYTTLVNLREKIFKSEQL